MNLKEILNYRTNCLICGELLTLDFNRSIRKRKLYINVTDLGIEIKSGHKEGVYLLLGFDGKYKTNSRKYKIYSEDLLLRKYCSNHSDITAILSIDSMDKMACGYSFFVHPMNNGNYGIYLHSETVHYRDKKDFWHVDVSYPRQVSIIAHARFSQKIDKVKYLNVPIINLSNVKNKEQFLDKIKLYTLFS